MFVTSPPIASDGKDGFIKLKMSMLFMFVGETHVMFKQVCAPTCLGNLLCKYQIKLAAVVVCQKEKHVGWIRLLSECSSTWNGKKCHHISIYQLYLYKTDHNFRNLPESDENCCESRHFSVWLKKLLWTCGLKPVKNSKISVPFPCQVFFSYPICSIVTTINKLL